jgi:CheY-like chemotaxis protein
MTLISSSQIHEIVVNLCNNAVHAMDEQGTIEVSIQQVYLESDDIPVEYGCEAGYFVRLSIQDTGCGIDEDHLEKIFEPYFSTKDETKGTGMGLATVQSIIVQHGGIIKVHSQLNVGTRFDIYLPLLSKIRNPIAEKTPGSQLKQGSGNILFIDDEPMLAELGKELLSHSGYNVSTYTDSSKALAKFKESPFAYDLVITDQTMPNLSGKELIMHIRTVRPEIPAILCTGHSNKIDREQAEKLAINAFVQKPFDYSELITTIQNVLQSA